MADSYVETVAGELAELALADEERSGDEQIVIKIAEIVGSSSQTLQEAFLTSVRVRRAEKRARALLAERAPSQAAVEDHLLSDGSDGDDSTDADPDTSELRNMLKELDQQNARDGGQR